MRIAVLVPNFSEFSGDARVAELQVKELIASGNEVDIYCLRGTLDVDGARKFEIGMPSSPVCERVYRLVFPLHLTKLFRTAFRMRDYDLVISHLYPLSTVGMLSKFLSGTHYTFWYHGIPPPKMYQHRYERLYMKAFIKLTGISTRNATDRVAVSRAAAEEYRRYVKQNCRVKYNQPDLSRFKRDITGIGVRKEFGFGDRPVILNVGRICPQKGAHLLLEAFEVVKKEIPDSILVLVGKPTYDYYFENLKKMTTSDVCFVGFVEDRRLPEFYAMCDVYATGTLWEAHNVPILEAQAMGKRVIGFDIPSLREGIDQQGILVPVGDTSELGKAIVAAIKEKNRGIQDA